MPAEISTDGGLSFVAAIDLTKFDQQIAAIEQQLLDIANAAKKPNLTIAETAQQIAAAYDPGKVRDFGQAAEDANKALVRGVEMLANAFGDEKLNALDQQLAGITDQSKQLETVLEFVKENVSDLKIDPAGTQQITQNVEALQEAMQRVDGSVNTVEQAVRGVMTPLGELNEQYRQLSDEADRLEEIESKTTEPGALAKLKDSLSEVYEKLDLVQAQMQKMQNPNFGNVGKAPVTIDIDKASKDQLKSNLIELKAYADRLREALSLTSDAETVEQYNSELQQTRERIDAINAKFDALNNKPKTLTIQLRELKKQLADMSPSDKGYDEILAKAAEIQNRLQNATKDLNLAVSNMAGLDARGIGKQPATINIDTASTDKLKAKLVELTEYASRLKEALALTTDAGTVEQYNAELKQTQERIDEINNKLGVSNSKSLTLTAQLRQLKNQLAGMSPSDNGYEQVLAKATALQNRIQNVRRELSLAASNTSGLDALKQGVTGMVGGFTAAASAAALFGGNNEKAQATMVKVFAVMQLVNGAEQLFTVLSTKSAANQFLLAQLRKMSAVNSAEAAVATEAVAVAEGEATVATEAATAAQAELNTVMAENPVGIILLAVTALATAIVYFTSRTDEAAEAQRQLNLALETFTKIAEISSVVASQMAAKRLAEMKRDGANAAAIRGEETNDLRKQVEIAKSVYDKANADLKAYGDDHSKLSKDQKEQYVKTKEAEMSAAQKYFDLENQLAIKRVDNQKAEADEELRSTTALADARVQAAKKGTTEEYNALRANIEARRAQDLKNPNLTSGEIVDINAKAARELYELRLQYEQQLYDDKISLAKAALDQAKAGSFEEYTAKVKLIDLEAQKALSQEGITSAKRKEIRAQEAKDLADLQDNFDSQLDQTAASIAVSEINTRLSEVRKGTQEELQLKKDLIDKQADLEVSGLQRSVQNEELRAAKTKEIYAKSLVDKKALDDAYADKSFQSQVAALKNQNDILNQQYEKVVSDNNSTPIQKDQAQGEILKNNADLYQNLINLAYKYASEGKGDYGALTKAVQEYLKALKLVKNQQDTNAKKTVADQWKETAEVMNTIGAGLRSLGQEISQTNQGLGQTVSSLGNMVTSLSSTLTLVQKIEDGSATTGDKVGSAVQGVVSLISLVVSASAQRALAEKQYQQDLLNQVHQYNLALNESLLLNSKLKENVFLTDFQGELRDGIAALGDAQKKYQDAVKALSAGQAKAGQRNVVSGSSVLSGIGAGAAVGAAVGSIVPVIGTAIGGIVGAIAGGIVGLFGGKKKKDSYVSLLEEYPELVQKTDDGVLKINTDLAKTLIANNLVSDSTKQLIQDTLDWQDAIDKANEQMKEIISDLAGGLGDDLRNSLVDAFEQGTDAAQAFAGSVEKTLNNVLSQMIFNNVFGGAFDKLQKQMQDSFGIGGDGNWEDDLTSFFTQYAGLTDEFDKQLKDAQAAAEAAGLQLFQNANDATSGANSLAGAFKGMSEQTADLLAGQFGGMRMTGVQQLALMNNQLNVLNRIADNTEFLRSLNANLAYMKNIGVKIVA